MRADVGGFPCSGPRDGPTAGERAIGMSSDLCQRTYDLSFKYIGCTAVSAEVAEVVSDELIMRSHAATLDFADPKQMLRFMLGHVARISSAPIEF
jgi:hypothetical protein